MLFLLLSILHTGAVTSKPTQSKLNAIINFPIPKNITEARSWFGVVNQVA